MSGFNRGPSLAERMKIKQQKKTSEIPAPESAQAPEDGAPEGNESEGQGSSMSRPASSADVLTAQADAARVDKSVLFIDLELIDVEAQVREDFNQDYIEDLATDFALAATHQPNQPITVWKRANGRYLLDDGENRYRAMKFAGEHRNELGVSDLAAFTTIRATVRGEEPSKLDRIQAQAKANLMRDQLNDVEVGKAAQLYLQEHPDARQEDIARWLGFSKVASGRVKVANALKLLSTCDADLIQQVGKGELSVKNAFKVQDERAKEQRADSSESGDNKAGKGTAKSEQMLDKATNGKNNLSATVPLTSLKLAVDILARVAGKHNVDIDLGDLDNFTRKSAMNVFKEDVLLRILESMDGK